MPCITTLGKVYNFLLYLTSLDAMHTDAESSPLKLIFHIWFLDLKGSQKNEREISDFWKRKKILVIVHRLIFVVKLCHPIFAFARRPSLMTSQSLPFFIYFCLGIRNIIKCVIVFVFFYCTSRDSRCVILIVAATYHFFHLLSLPTNRHIILLYQ